jgi:hypothetical protein
VDLTAAARQQQPPRVCTDAARAISGVPAAGADAASGVVAARECLRLLRAGSLAMAEACVSPAAAAPAAAAPSEECECACTDAAVVYIPGFNTPLSRALQCFGQLLALANLPTNYRPFVLSWPGGRALSYLAAHQATSEQWMADDLLALFCGLHAHGVTTVPCTRPTLHAIHPPPSHIGCTRT